MPSSFDRSRSTRRTATVTTSAAAASIASIICAFEAYLPVPTISRERNSRPAIVNGCGSVIVAEEIRSACATTSASAHEVDDLQRIVSCELYHRQGRAVAQNGSVALDDDSARVEVERGEKISDRESDRHATLGAVHGESHLSDGIGCQGACQRHTCER